MTKYLVDIIETNVVRVEVEVEDGIIPSDDALKSMAIENIQNGYGYYDDTEYEFNGKQIQKD